MLSQNFQCKRKNGSIFVSFFRLIFKNKSFVILFGIVTFSILIRLLTINLPLDRDEGAYAYAGRMIFSGEIPYLSFFDHKPPVVYLFYGLAGLFGGTEVYAIRATSILINVFSILGIYLLVKKIHSKKTGLFAALIFSIFSLDLSIEGISFNTEVVVNLFLIFTTLFFLSKNKIRLLFSGIFFILALFSKQVAILALPFLCCLFIFQKHRMKDFIYWFLGCFVMASILLLWLFCSGGLMGFMGGVIYNFGYVKIIKSTFWFSDIWFFIPSQIILWVLTFYSILKIKINLFTIILSLWLIFSAYFTYFDGRNFRHYFILMLPPLAMMAANGLRSLIDENTNFKKKIILVFILFLMLFPFIEANHNLINTYDSSFRIFGSVFLDTKTIALQLKPLLQESDYIYVNFPAPEIYFYTGAKSSSRMIYYPFNGFDSTTDLKRIKVQVEKLNNISPSEINSEILKHAPKFVITDAGQRPIIGNYQYELKFSNKYQVWEKII